MSNPKKLFKNNIKIFRLFVVSSLIIIGSFAFTNKANAATYYWVGGTTNSNTSNPANWKTTAGACADSANLNVPTTGDAINFISNCVNNATVDANLSIAAFNTGIGYTGTITLNNINMTVGGLSMDGGNLNILNGSILEKTGTVVPVIGNNIGSNGTVTVDGVGSSFIISGNLTIGSKGIGILSILHGGLVSSIIGFVGYSTPGGIGTITVDGTGSLFTSVGGLIVGYGSSGNLTIQNGGTVSSGISYLGRNSGSNGVAIINGVGSNWTTNNGNFNIGFNSNTTGSLTISNNGLLNVGSGILTVANATDSTGTINIGSGYTMDLIQAGTITTGLGTAKLPPLTPTVLINTNIYSTSIDWDWGDLSGATGYKVYNASDNTLLTTISSATSNWTQDSLSHNTSYSIYVRGFNDQGEGYASSDSSEVYTLANTPTNLSTSSNSNSVTLSVDNFPNETSGQSGYYFSRSGANSGWIQTNSWADTGLSCGHSYDYSVIYRNYDGVETDPISITKSTSNCPSSGSSASSRYNNLISMGNLQAAEELKKEFPLQIVQPNLGNTNINTLLNKITRTLRDGSRGDDVKSLQEYLNTKLNLTLVLDGRFGPMTKTVVILFQKTNGLVADGIVGPKTREMMK